MVAQLCQQHELPPAQPAVVAGPLGGGGAGPGLLQALVRSLVELLVGQAGADLAAVAATQLLPLLSLHPVTFLVELPHVNLVEEEAAVATVHPVRVLRLHLNWGRGLELLLDELDPLLLVQLVQILLQLGLHYDLRLGHFWHPSRLKCDPGVLAETLEILLQLRSGSDWAEAGEASQDGGALVEFVVVVVVVVIELRAQLPVTVSCCLEEPAVIEGGIYLVILPVLPELLHRPVDPIEGHTDRSLLLPDLEELLAARLDWSCSSPQSQLGWSLSWPLPLYFLSLLSEPLSLGLLVSSELLEVEEEGPTVDTRSGSGSPGVKMTALWCSFT